MFAKEGITYMTSENLFSVWSFYYNYLRNEGFHVNFARDPKYSWFHEHLIPEIEFIVYIYILLLISKNIKLIFNFGIKTDFYLKYKRINGLVGVLNGKAEQPAWTRTAIRANNSLALHVRLGCGSLSITAPVTLLANEFDVRSVLHGQVTLAASIKFV